MNEVKFSLIVATLGRSDEIAALFESFATQTVGASAFEVILVDQNDKIDLAPVVAKYNKRLSVKHIRSDKKGLSLNRNIGLKDAKGEVVCFPDDDCAFYPDTLETVGKLFDARPDAKVLVGRIYDRERKKNVLREWKARPFRLTRSNFFRSYSSITLFCKDIKLPFDEQLGVGTYFGSYEDADYAYRLIVETGAVYYEPVIEVWHPEQNLGVMSKEKVYSYGLGFGALCKKHWGWTFWTLYLQALTFHRLRLAVALLKRDRVEADKRRAAIRSRKNGFKQYEKN